MLFIFKPDTCAIMQLFRMFCVCLVIVIQSAWRGMKGRRRAKTRRQAAELIRRSDALLFCFYCSHGCFHHCNLGVFTLRSPFQVHKRFHLPS